MRASYSRLTALVAAGVLLLGAAACGDDDSNDASTGSGDNSSSDSSSGDGSSSQAIEITSPADGADVEGSGFEVDFASNEDLGPTDTGKHHVHVFFDGSDDYEVVESDSYTVDEPLDAGEHTIKAALANADHSLTGDEAEITVNVTGDGSGGGSSDTTDDDSGY